MSYLIPTDVLRRVLANGSGDDEVNNIIADEIRFRELEEEVHAAVAELDQSPGKNC